MSRDERTEYRGDVWYEEWRRGLPEGSISDDRIDDAYYSGQSAESLVAHEAQRREDERLERQRQEEYEEYCRQQQYEEEHWLEEQE
ncbi:hypothetical protein [Petrachloros mirabilis]